jgi:TPP-dependent pyruvate/acetoin dehydrogenase alpha subunit
MVTLDEIKKKLEENPLWQPHNDDPQELWDLYDQAVEEIAKMKKANKKPDPDEIFDETFPGAGKPLEEDDEF